MTDILAALAAPFPPEAIDWRVGSTTTDKKRGMALAYIDARTVQDRLDEVCGAFWQNQHTVAPDGKKVTCAVGIKVDGEWLWRSDGAGETDYEAEKGSYSDAFKRAGVKWGIGRYLYDLKAPWVEIEPMGKSFKIAAHEMAKLNALASGKATPAKPAAAAPAAKPAPKAEPQTAADAFWAAFWERTNYELKGANITDLLAFASAFEAAAKRAPSLDALLKLDQDNDASMAALKGQSPSAHKQAREVFGAAQFHFTNNKAA
jgi:hypothetical protein